MAQNSEFEYYFLFCYISIAISWIICLFVVLNRISCIPGLPWTNFLCSFEHLILLCPSHESLDYRHALPHPVHVAMGIKFRTLCVLGKQSADSAASLPPSSLFLVIESSEWFSGPLSYSERFSTTDAVLRRDTEFIPVSLSAPDQPDNSRATDTDVSRLGFQVSESIQAPKYVISFQAKD